MTDQFKYQLLSCFILCAGCAEAPSSRGETDPQSDAESLKHLEQPEDPSEPATGEEIRLPTTDEAFTSDR